MKKIAAILVLALCSNLGLQANEPKDENGLSKPETCCEKPGSPENEQSEDGDRSENFA